MAELNLKQITDKLNSEFASDVRKLVFWYDANAEFQEDIDSIELENAKVLHLEPDNQFYIKYFLEREDTTTNYLVYAPFAKPSIRDNHLADTIRYSKEFFADRASLLTLDLGIDERYKPVIQHYIKFFANKDRTQKFYDLEIENFNRSTIEVALMSVLCKDKTASFEEVLRSILTDDGLQDNKYLAEFEKYDLLSAFWQQADVAFGYNDPKPTLEKLVITMFITYAAKSIHTDMPQAWKPFISYKFGNIIAFMDNLMNSYLYGTRFDKISEIIYNAINGKNYLEKMEVETLVDCNIFAGVDELLISWIIGRLENEDIGAKLNGKTIPELCVERRKQHFGKNFRNEYFILQNAFDMITLNLAIIAAVSITWNIKSLFILVAGIVVCAIWLLFIRNYKLLNAEKFNVINTIEKRLPVTPFNDEWEKLKNNKKYTDGTKLERTLPIMFIILYGVAVVTIVYMKFC